MKPIPKTRCGAFMWCLIAGAAPAAQAQVWPSAVSAVADCLPDRSYNSQPASSIRTCSNADASAYAQASFTSLKASISTSAAAPVGDYFATAALYDSVLATPADARLSGKDGFVRFTAAFDGTLKGRSSFVMSVARGVYDPAYNAYSINYLRLTTDYFGAPQSNVFFSNRDFADRAVDTRVWWDMPVVYGAATSYQIEFTVKAFGPNSEADFAHTLALVGLDAFDAQGQAVAAGFSAGSGAVLPTSPVPEPQRLALMLAGLGLLGWRLRRA